MRSSSPTNLAKEWTVRAIDKDHCVAVWDRVLIQVWQLATTASAVVELEKIARAYITEQKGPISSMAVVERTSPPPGDEVRSLLSRFYRELAPQMNQQIVVAEGGGFRGAIVRAVGVTLSTLSPGTLPFRFVGSVQEASSLIAPHLSRLAGGEPALRRVVEGIREESRKVAFPG